MPQRLDTRSPDFGTAFAALLASKREAAADVDQAVQKIIADVVAGGDAALVAYSQKFDRVDLARSGPRGVGGRDRRRPNAPPRRRRSRRFAWRTSGSSLSTSGSGRKILSSPMRSASNSAGAGMRSRRPGFMCRAAPRAIRLRC